MSSWWYGRSWSTRALRRSLNARERIALVTLTPLSALGVDDDGSVLAAPSPRQRGSVVICARNVRVWVRCCHTFQLRVVRLLVSVHATQQRLVHRRTLLAARVRFRQTVAGESARELLPARPVSDIVEARARQRLRDRLAQHGVFRLARVVQRGGVRGVQVRRWQLHGGVQMTTTLPYPTKILQAHRRGNPELIPNYSGLGKIVTRRIGSFFCALCSSQHAKRARLTKLTCILNSLYLQRSQ